jgi:hypothetical protein
MEHRRPNGALVKGWYCGWCGQPVAMGGHPRGLRETGGCIGNLSLVLALNRANMHTAKTKPHFKYSKVTV